MKSLPTLLTTKQLNKLLDNFPDNAVIQRSPITAVVFAPNGDKVLSAVRHPLRAAWSVRAVEGLITATAQ